MRTLMLVAVAVITAGPAHAQYTQTREEPAEQAARVRAACDRAAQAVGRSSPESVSGHLLRDLSYCGTGKKAAAIAQAARRLRNSEDTALLARYWNRTARIDDRNLFAAASEIVLDQRASVSARVYALLSLVRTSRADYTPTYANLVGGWRDGEPGGGCVNTVSSHNTRDIGAQLPPGWERSVEQIRTRLLTDSSEPLDVRTAAWCIDVKTRRRN